MNRGCKSLPAALQAGRERVKRIPFGRTLLANECCLPGTGAVNLAFKRSRPYNLTTGPGLRAALRVPLPRSARLKGSRVSDKRPGVAA